MRRTISGPAQALLDRAGVSPEEIDTALGEMVSGKGIAILRAHHPLIRHIQQTTSINIVQIARRSRTLLIEIEQQRDNKPFWNYREHRPRWCTFSCPGILPDTIEIALHDQLLDKVVESAIAMTGTKITDVSKTDDGWLRFNVVPPWHIF